MVDIFHFEKVTSTNDVAAEKARQGAAHLSVITADIQTEGRGRLGRIWQTFPEGGLAMSIVVRGKGALLPILTSVAVHQALAMHGGRAIALKWPNDILANNLKISGILIESYPDPNTHGQRFYIVGIGVNINTPPTGMPDNLAATTLEAITGKKCDKNQILAEIIAKFHKNLDLQAQTGNSPIIEYYRTHCRTLGQNVRWLDAGHEIYGKAFDINDEGNLLLLTDDGTKHICITGDVVHCF